MSTIYVYNTGFNAVIITLRVDKGYKMDQFRTLGKVSAYLISRLYEENKPVFTISDAQIILRKGYNQTTDLLSEMVKRKAIITALVITLFPVLRPLFLEAFLFSYLLTLMQN